MNDRNDFPAYQQCLLSAAPVLPRSDMIAFARVLDAMCEHRPCLGDGPALLLNVRTEFVEAIADGEPQLIWLLALEALASRPVLAVVVQVETERACVVADVGDSEVREWLEGMRGEQGATVLARAHDSGDMTLFQVGWQPEQVERMLWLGARLPKLDTEGELQDDRGILRGLLNRRAILDVPEASPARALSLTFCRRHFPDGGS